MLSSFLYAVSFLANTPQFCKYLHLLLHFQILQINIRKRVSQIDIQCVSACKHFLYIKPFEVHFNNISKVLGLILLPFTFVKLGWIWPRLKYLFNIYLIKCLLSGNQYSNLIRIFKLAIRVQYTTCFLKRWKIPACTRNVNTAIICYLYDIKGKSKTLNLVCYNLPKVEVSLITTFSKNFFALSCFAISNVWLSLIL